MNRNEKPSGNFERSVVILISSLLLVLFCAPFAFAQTFVYRLDPTPVMTTSGNVPLGGFPTAYIVPGATIKLCTDSACNVRATAYTDATGITQCAPTAPVTLPGTSVCTSTAGSQGQFGFWVQPGTYYYTVTTTTGTFGPYPISSPTVGTLGGPGLVSSNNAGGLTPMTTVLDVSQAAGASASLKIAAAAAALTTGGTLDGRNIHGAQTWNTDAFSGISAAIDFQCAAATYTVSTNSTIPSNVHLFADQGCIFSVSGGVTLTINGAFDGPIAQHFSGAGNVIIGGPVAQIYPQWFAGADLGAQIVAAKASCPSTAPNAHGGCLILIPAGSYTLSTLVTNTNPYISILGSGPFATYITCTLNSDCFRLTANPWTTNQAGHFGNFTLIGQGAANANTVAVHISGIIGLSLENLVVTNFKGANNVGIWVEDGASFADPAGNFVERLVMLAVHYDFNKLGLKHSVVTGVAISNSMFYTKMLDARFNVDNGQIGWLMQGDGTVNGSPYLFGSEIHAHFNCINGGTMWKLNNGAVTGNNNYGLTGETTSGAACVGMNVDAASFGAGGSGIISLGAGGTTASITANKFFHSGLVFDPGTGYNAIDETSNIFAVRVPDLAGKYGVYLYKFVGAGSRQGVGFDLLFDGTNWNALGNSITNTGAGLLFDGGNLCFYVSPNTGGATNTFADATLTTYQRLCLTENGTRFGSVAAGGTNVKKHLSASASINFGTVNANNSVDQTFALAGAVNTDTCYVMGAAAPAAGISYVIFGDGASAPVVRAVNSTVGNINVGSVTLNVDCWGH